MISFKRFFFIFHEEW